MADYDSRKRKPPEYPRKGTIHMKKWTNTNPMRRLLSLALSVVMVLSVLPMPSIAAEGDGLCEHHPEHTGCGYVAAVEGHDCGHVCGEECYTVTTDCQHVHDESCYSDGVLPAEGEEKAADACAHTACTEESGCVTKAHTCAHKHDGSCGYVEAVAGSPCTYQCDLCTGASEPELLLEDTVLTDWEWVDPDEWLDETGSFAMPGVTEDCPAFFEDVVEYLPTQITALIDGGEVTLDLGDWSCDDYPVETGTSQGEFVFTATLPEGYVLADGSNTLPLPVTVAPMDLSDGEDVSGYDNQGTGQNESWDAVDFNGVRNWNKETSEFEFGSSNTVMYYRKITQQYTGDVEWTKYDHHKTTQENPTGYYIDNVGYCVYSKTAEITGTLTINADIHLVLWADGTGNDSSDMVLTVGNIQIPEGKTLTIWTRNAGYQGGKLIVKGDISGEGTLVVRDGYVEAQNITCKFSTGGSANGKESLGVVKANSISDKSDEANWGGVMVENGAGLACGTAAQELIYDLQCDTLTIDSGKTLTVGWDGYNNIGARQNVKLIANNLVNDGTLINKAKLYYNTLSGSGSTASSNGGYGYYKNENGQKVYRPFTLVTSDITELTNKTNDGWYLVSGNVEWANRVAVAANTTVNLVLADGCTLTAREGITVGGTNPTLIIWCQEAGTGTLNAQTSNKECAAIGTNGYTSAGVITIHGGNINAKYTGSGSIQSENCGLGGRDGSAVCTVTINGGTINTPALVSNDLTINGGTITVSQITGKFLAPATDGGSTFVTADSDWASNNTNSRTNRRGLFFVGDTGEVCTGSDTELTLARAMEVPADKTLVIPQGKTLNAGSHLTNSGAVCVGGAYTGSLSGDIYYRLSVTGGTAASATETKTIGGVTYVKAGSTVTLTPDAAPTGKRFDHWNLPAGLTLTDNTFTMPDKAVDISAAYSDAVVITQPPEDNEITYGEIATLNVSAENPSNTTDGITYQWYQVINNKEEKLSGETNELLELTTLNAGTYSYFCRVTWNGISIDSSRATVTVKKAQASVTITGDPRKDYDGTPAVLTDTMYTTTGDGAVTVEYKKQGETNYSTTAPTNAGSYTVRVTLAAGTNYTGAYATKNFTISKAYNTWTKKPSVKTPAYYGDTDLVTYEALSGNEDVKVIYKDINNNPVDPENAGDYKVEVSLEESGNYTGLAMVSMDLTILPRSIEDRDVTVTLDDDFVYDAEEKTQTVTIQYKDKTLVKGVDYELTGVISATDANSYTLTVTGKGNYSGTTTKAWKITKASITPVVSLADTVYGENLNPSINSDGNPGDGDVTYTYYSDAACNNEVTPKDVGTYYVKASVAQTDNYQSGTSEAVSFQITKKALTVTANNKTITYGDAPANDGVEYSGFVLGENPSVLGGTLAYDYSYSRYGNVGDYTITPKGLTSGNYDITFADGTLTVNQKKIGIDWSNTSLAYNKAEQAPTATATATDLVNNDKCTITVTGQQTNVGNYTATASSLSNANYKLPTEVTQAFDIYAVAPTATLEDAESVYTGSEVPLLTVTDIDGGTVYYSLDKTDWSTEIPKAIQCGEHTVYYYIDGDSNHTDIGSPEAPESITANILPFTASTPTASASNFEYGTETELAFSVKTDLTGDITYQWFEVTTDKNGTSVHTPLPGETQKSMTLIPNAGEHTYICVATCDGYSQDSAPVTVEVTAGTITPGTDVDLSGLWLEGGEAPADTDQSSIDKKSPSSGFLTSYSEAEGTGESKGYPTGMEVYKLVEKDGQLVPDRVEIFTNLLKYEGCSIRITGKPGIRMITSIDEKLKKELIQDGYEHYTLEAYGTVAQWSKNLGGQPLTLSTGNPGYAYDADSGKDPIFGRSGGRVQYTNVLVWDELADDKYNEDIVMRPFIKLRKGTQELVIYGGIVSRSIGYVAQQNADTFPVGSAGYNYVHNIIDKVANLNQSNESTTTAGGNGE